MFKEVSEYLGIDSEKIKTIEDFKTIFDAEFIRANALTDEHDSVKKIVGKKIGTIDTELKRLLGNFGVDLKDVAELKDKPIKDKIEYGLKKIIEDKNIEFEEFKKTNSGGDEKITKEWTEKYNKAVSELNDTKELLNATAKEFNGYKESAANEKKNFVINSAKNEALKKLKWKTGTPDLMKTGFVSQIESKYKLDLEENGNIIVLNSEGKRIPNPKVTGTFMSIDEVLESEAIAADVYEKNVHAGQKPLVNNAPINNTPVQPQGGKTPFTMHPRAMSKV